MRRSCRTTTAGGAIGVVRFSRVPRSSTVSDHVGLHYQVCWHLRPFLYHDWSVGCFNNHYNVQSTHVDNPVGVSLE